MSGMAGGIAQKHVVSLDPAMRREGMGSDPEDKCGVMPKATEEQQQCKRIQQAGGCHWHKFAVPMKRRG